MVRWTDEMRREASASFDRSMTEAAALFADARAMIEDPTKADVGVLLRAFLRGVGSHVDVEFFRLRQLTDELGRTIGALQPNDSFYNAEWSVDAAVLERFCPEVASLTFELRSNEGAEATEILEWCPNECMDLAWPTSLAGFMRRPRRLPFRVYATDDAVAYVDPYRYQLLSRDGQAMWATASPRCLSKQFFEECDAVAIDRIDRTVVVVQDRFGFGNFCHFLFDGVTRILHYVEHFGYRDELFVMGGIPGPYQELVCRALCEVIQLPENSLYFPDRGYLFKAARKFVWFSDQKELHVHPAQMAHPQSLGLLTGVADRVAGTTCDHRRLYISRGDADRRRIVNEPELISVLERRGFRAVQLATIPVEEQVGLFRAAETVVAPHGMGLTHIAMGRNLGRVIELFHPTAGTDAYAFIARSAGMHYDRLLGEGIPATHSDYKVDIDRVIDLVGPEGLPRRRPNWQKRANLIPASSTFHGFSGGLMEPPDGWPTFDFSRMNADDEVRYHRKLAPALNTLVGQWEGIQVAPRLPYVISCWVWLPEHFPADELSVRIAGWAAERMTRAELRLAGTWQRICFAAISPQDARRCDVGLHVVGHEGAAFASTCWQMERGQTPSGYLKTG